MPIIEALERGSEVVETWRVLLVPFISSCSLLTQCGVTQFFFRVFNSVVALLAPLAQSHLKTSLSEEGKLLAVQCLSLVLRPPSCRIATGPPLPAHRILASGKLRITLGNAASLLLGIAREEKFKTLRVAALGALSHLHACARHPDALGFFFPGIALGLSSIAQSDYKAGSAVVAAACSCWRIVALCVLSDEAMDDILPSLSVSSGKSSSVVEAWMSSRSKATCHSTAKTRVSSNPLWSVDNAGSEIPFERNENWAKMTMGKLGTLLSALLSHPSHEWSWKARLERARWSAAMLVHCKRALSVAGPAKDSLMGDIVCATGDDDVRVRSLAMAWLKRVCGAAVSGEKISSSASWIRSVRPLLIRSTIRIADEMGAMSEGGCAQEARIRVLLRNARSHIRLLGREDNTTGVAISKVVSSLARLGRINCNAQSLQPRRRE